jgi:hypothetical protein
MRTLVWVSTGAASMVAAKLTLRENPDAILVRCETFNEDPDNYRFEADCAVWLGKKVTLIKSERFSSVPDVWMKERYMSGIRGASCSRAMKAVPRLAFQHPHDLHILGYTADALDANRFERLKTNYFETKFRAPLIEAGVTKAGVLAIIERTGIKLPRTYAMGFPNANCMQSGCVKATSPAYWALYRKHFPREFERTAAYARELGCTLAVLNGERIFIDEIPLDHPTINPIVPSCDFLCQLAEVA